jgi:lysyl-tRNA synthetase class II
VKSPTLSSRSSISETYRSLGDTHQDQDRRAHRVCPGIRAPVKIIPPLPEKWHGLKDVDTRYRQRYVDLIVTPEARQTFLMRTKIISALRRTWTRTGSSRSRPP